jgi:hypothetical protein
MTRPKPDIRHLFVMSSYPSTPKIDGHRSVSAQGALATELRCPRHVRSPLNFRHDAATSLTSKWASERRARGPFGYLSSRPFNWRVFQQNRPKPDSCGAAIFDANKCHRCPNQSGLLSALGRVKWKVVPKGLPGNAQSLPPCASMIDRQMERPKPIPWDFVVKKASNIRSM